jgi:hypothetical protein
MDKVLKNKECAEHTLTTLSATFPTGAASCKIMVYYYSCFSRQMDQAGPIFTQIPAIFAEADHLRLCWQAKLLTKSENIVPARCSVWANRKRQISTVEFINGKSFQYDIPGIIRLMECPGASLSPRGYNIDV